MLKSMRRLKRLTHRCAHDMLMTTKYPLHDARQNRAVEKAAEQVVAHLSV